MSFFLCNFAAQNVNITNYAGNQSFLWNSYHYV